LRLLFLQRSCRTDGDSEDNLGRGIANSPLGSKAIVYTKAGKYIRWKRGSKISGAITPWDPFTVPIEERVVVPDYSRQGAHQSFQESMERMGGLDGVHTLRLHDPDSIEGGMEAAVSADGLIAGLRELREQGKIEQVSFGMNANVDHKVITPNAGGAETTAWTPAMIIDMIRAVPEGTFDSCLLAYGWNLIGQDAWPVMEECAKHGIKVHVAGAMQALFTPRANAGSAPVTQTEAELQDKVDQWTELAETFGVSLGAVAINFAALPSVVDKVVIGMRHEDEVTMNVKCMEEEVPAGAFSRLSRPLC